MKLRRPNWLISPRLVAPRMFILYDVKSVIFVTLFAQIWHFYTLKSASKLLLVVSIFFRQI